MVFYCSVFKLSINNALKNHNATVMAGYCRMTYRMS